jgi:putative membrane protein
METVQDTSELDIEPKRPRFFVRQFSWRIILVRLVVYGLTLIAVALLVPNIYFVDRRIIVVLVMAAGLGLLNAFVKPIVQFLTLPFIFASFGLVIVLINTIILLLLALLFEERFFVGGLLWAIIGGLVMGIFTSVLESLFGLNLPIVPKTQEVAGSQASVDQSITSMLVSEMAGDKAGQPALSEDVSESDRAGDSGESTMMAMGDTAGDSSEPINDEAPAATDEQDLIEPHNNANNMQPGDEK